MERIGAHITATMAGTLVADLRQAVTTLAIAKHRYAVCVRGVWCSQPRHHPCGCSELGPKWSKDVNAAFNVMMATMKSRIEAAEVELETRHYRGHSTGNAYSTTMPATLSFVGTGAYWGSSGDDIDSDGSIGVTGVGVDAARGLAATVPVDQPGQAGDSPKQARQRALLNRFSQSFSVADRRPQTAVTLHSLCVAVLGCTLAGWLAGCSRGGGGGVGGDLTLVLVVCTAATRWAARLGLGRLQWCMRCVFPCLPCHTHSEVS